MLWLKRNWLLLVIGLVALGLLAGAVVFLLAQQGSAAGAEKALKEAKEEMVRLRGFTPALDDANIQKVKEEVRWYQEFIPKIKPLLVADTNLVVNIDNVTFKSLLENTIAELSTNAESAGISLRPRYGFTFDAQRQQVQFTNNVIPILTGQIYEIKELCEILFSSKVHSLEGLRRVRAYPGEPAGSSDYLDGKSIVTNAAAGGSIVITPYELTFRGFTSELSAVLGGLQRSKFFFSVKRVNLQALDVPKAVDVPPPTQPKAPPGGKKAPTAPPPAPAVQTIMEEKPLKITLALEVVKLYPVTTATDALAVPPPTQ